MTTVAGVYEREIADRRSSPSVRHFAERVDGIFSKFQDERLCDRNDLRGFEIKVDMIHCKWRSLSQRINGSAAAHHVA